MKPNWDTLGFVRDLISKTKMSAREMAQCLRALIALAEDLCLVPRSSSQPLVTPVPGYLMLQVKYSYTKKQVLKSQNEELLDTGH